MNDVAKVSNANPNWFAPVSVISGLIFLMAILAAAIFIPEPSSFQIFVFRVVIALAAASFGATIPGFLNIDIPVWGKGVIAAGGALALFVIVFNINPPSLIANDETAFADDTVYISQETNNHIGLDAVNCNAVNHYYEGHLFDNAILTSCDFSDAAISRASFKGANLASVNFSELEAFNVVFESSALVASDFTLSNLIGSNFDKAGLREVRFFGSFLKDTSFREADMTGTYLAGADITGADFTDAINLTQSQINSAYYDPEYQTRLYGTTRLLVDNSELSKSNDILIISSVIKPRNRLVFTKLHKST